jgi:N-acetyl-anhydromuramyl-L-alanine amidase AmpD
MVAANGTIYQTNRLETVSDHAFDQNDGSIGICFAGDFSSSIPPAAQLESGGKLCAWLTGLLWLPTSSIVGLSEIAKTQSPGKQWLSGQRWKDKLLEEVEASLQTSGAEHTALIASLQAEIQSLEDEITRLKQQPGPPPATPAPEAEEGPIQVPAIKDLADALPKHSDRKYKTREISDIRYLVVHHSAVPPSVTPQRIADYHVKTRGWPGIGYHLVVDDDSTIYQTNHLQTVSYHAGNANPIGVGICFNGNFTNGVPPAAQLQAGAHLIAWLMQELDLPWDAVKGHKDLMDTACPGEQWLKGKQWKQMLYQEVTRVQQEAIQANQAS